MAHRVGTLVTGQSAVVVSQLTKELSSDSSLQICTATTTAELWQQIESAKPRVVLLDAQLAGDGTPQLVAKLRQNAKVATLLRSDRNTSSLMLLDAMEAGALAILDKPASNVQAAEMIPSIIWSIRAAQWARFISPSTPELLPLEDTRENSIFAIGGGMGALASLTQILMQIPANAPGVMVISPLPVQVITAWVDRLNRRGKMAVKLAADGDQIQAGQVLVAPGNLHVMLRRSAQGFRLAVKDGPAVFHQKPSIEILFNSIAEVVGGDAVGVLLGGAGVDGVAGLMRLRRSGCRTIVESELTSVMADAPARANKCGAAEAMVPANQIAAKLMELASKTSSQAA